MVKSQFSHTGGDVRYLVMFVHKKPAHDAELFMGDDSEGVNTSLPAHLQISGNFYWFRNSVCVVASTHDGISAARSYLDNTDRDMFHEFVLGKGALRVGEVLDSDYTQTFIEDMVAEYHAYYPAYLEAVEKEGLEEAHKIYEPFYEKYESGRSQKHISSITLDIPKVGAAKKAKKPRTTKKAEEATQFEEVKE